ncbi:hypothetical protein L2719_14855 [Shewanella schlegeliana]|uniref:Anti-sigma factor n=1 Tax=Shewanella schlegeliana TaxID=190308 RepID=A0ABS1T1Y7_9GAMM|nr:hypothetical protein [Shewanella schlegeliana]MBL4914149.1 hypothetical protein [Shewanella schlegeliana]MCL1110814.1 hypothetical protein [Shewanella schlegeliana]GIU36403.1 hypothetical protein TUM4433_35120 [Shewanella schlegeliana]
MTDKEHEVVEAEIKSLYQKIDKEQPPTELDEQILTMARSRVAKPVQSQSFWRKYRWPLSSAASVLVVVTLFVINPAMKSGDNLEQGEPVMMSSPPKPQMMRSMDTPKQMDNNVTQAVQDSAPVGADLTAQLDNIEQLIRDKKIAEAYDLLQQLAEQAPQLLQATHPFNERYLKLQKVVMSGH